MVFVHFLNDMYKCMKCKWDSDWSPTDASWCRCLSNILVYWKPPFFLSNYWRKNNRKLKKLSGKKRFPLFLLSMYVFFCFFLFVCLSVIALQTSSFNIGSWNLSFFTIYLRKCTWETHVTCVTVCVFNHASNNENDILAWCM